MSNLIIALLNTVAATVGLYFAFDQTAVLRIVLIFFAAANIVYASVNTMAAESRENDSLR